MLKKSLIAAVEPVANKKQIYIDDKIRITVLTDRLIRVEYDLEAKFEDNATQSIWFRNLGEYAFDVKKDKKGYIITTEKVTLFLNSKGKLIKAKFKGDNKSINCTKLSNLKGTRRTLDASFGAVKIKDGIVSRDKVAIYNDSSSLVLKKDGELTARSSAENDIYIFAYGHDYIGAVKALYAICGDVPLVPRYALGVWWSRYRYYSQQEYMDVLQRFIDHQVPLSVATIDMDWHWTDLNKKFNTNYHNKRPLTDHPCTGGWTGYSWNTDLFPDHKGMLDWIHENDMKITLNLHPADGVRYFEDAYPQMARALGVDPSSKNEIPFDLASSDFINAYFDILHKPLEKEGVDFWWIDWQQGNKSTLAGLDPLWALNHYHFYDNAENGQLPLILSRYAGVGSHRYPLGFSGDTAVNWNVFRFQPYFTATASNIGYTWWSHDIGGHHFGYRDDELYARWLEFGTFSPIMRLHSTMNDLLSKEPWIYSSDSENIGIFYLRLRHSMIPYLYSMDYRTHYEGRALCEPLYYADPENENAYKYQNNYYFGSELIVCPITEKCNKKNNKASTTAWLPKGRWTDIFTGQIYEGDKTYTMSRTLDKIPVLAKAGAIIPTSLDEGNSCKNPKSIKLSVFRGEGSFSLFEDDGSINYHNTSAETSFSVSECESVLTFSISRAVGCVDSLPENRDYTIVFSDIYCAKKYTVLVNGKTLIEFSADKTIYSKNALVINVKDIKPTDEVVITVKDYKHTTNRSFKDKCAEEYSRWQRGTMYRTIIYNKFLAGKFSGKLFTPRCVKNAIKDV